MFGFDSGCSLLLTSLTYSTLKAKKLRVPSEFCSWRASSHHKTLSLASNGTKSPCRNMSGLPMQDFPSKSIANIKNMLKIIGPHSCDALVKSSLDSCTNKFHWAINSYYRNYFINGPECGMKKSSASRNCQSSRRYYRSLESQERSPGESIPIEILVVVLNFLDFTSLSNWCSISKKFRSHHTKLDSVSAAVQPLHKSIQEQAEHEAFLTVWSQQLTYRSYVINKRDSFCKGLMVGGRRPDRINESSNFHDSTSIFVIEENLIRSANTPYTSQNWYSILRQPTDSLNAFQLFKLCYIAEKTKSCLHCRAMSSVVPVVYGFPSTSLIALQQQRKLIMGGDYLIEGAASFTCLKCSCQFFSYPYSCCIIDVLES